MSRNRQNNSIEALQIPHIHDDARVEILLFLGIVFWCWMLIVFYQGKFSENNARSLALYWNGESLKTSFCTSAVLSEDEKAQKIPAAVAPLLFQPIPINFASQELLSTISGIGPELSKQIVKTRDNKGFFTQPEDLLSVPGISNSRMSKFAPQFSFAVSL
jgi:competence ComEA-like helix-hairpin-helix protein